MEKPNSFTLNDFYNTLMETFTDLEYEFVDKEEYENAQLMLNAQKELEQDREIYRILNGD